MSLDPCAVQTTNAKVWLTSIPTLQGSSKTDRLSPTSVAPAGTQRICCRATSSRRRRARVGRRTENYGASKSLQGTRRRRDPGSDAGRANHRDWEALAAGAIPLVGLLCREPINVEVPLFCARRRAGVFLTGGSTLDERLVPAQVDWDASPAMAELYEGLPVLRIRDWRSVTPDFLRKELSRVERDPDVDLKKLYLRRADFL